MSQYLRILCRSNEPLSRAALARFIRDGGFFDAAPRFEPPSDTAEAAAPEWEHFEIHPPGSTRPIVLHHAAPKTLADSVEELLTTLRDAGLEQSHPALIQRLRDSQQLFTFDIDPRHMTEEAWEMLDATEAFVARSRDGVLFVAGEGIYDAALQLICGW